MKRQLTCGTVLAVLLVSSPAILANDFTDLQRSTLAMQSPESPAVSDAEQKQASQDRPETESMSAAREESVLKFAEREEPELFELLKFLKHKRNAAYQRALLETGRTQQRLENLQQRDPELYQIDSQIWKTRSKLNLIAAQLSVKQSDESEKKLASLVTDLETQEIARIKLMRDRAAKQLEKLDSQLKDRTADSSASVEKSLESWKNRIKKQSNSRKKS
jgi:hypothetical protein